jgi:hypothetical protein
LRAGLTRCLNEGKVVLLGQERVRQIPEKLLQQTGNTIDVVEEILGVSEVKVAGTRICKTHQLTPLDHKRAMKTVLRTCVKQILELVDMRHRARKPIDALDIQAK